MNSDQFYSALPLLSDFKALAAPENYRPLPRDWAVIAADVKDSTRAIQEGKYRAVNTLGVCVISSMINLVKPVAVPYVFGGDGASVCIPARFVPQAEKALAATRRMAKEAYGLQLRTGVFSHEELLASGVSVRVARYRLSEHCVQAAFSGGGLARADLLLKNRREAEAPEAGEGFQPDYSGLECRWKNVPAEKGEVVALLIRAGAGLREKEAAEIYGRVIEEVETVYGESWQCRPVREKQIRLSFGNKLALEWKAKTHGRPFPERAGYWVKIRLQNLLGIFLMGFGLRAGGVEWGNYRRQLVENADFRKFDDMLRIVLSGDAGQRERLTAFLEARKAEGCLAYGLHVSSSAVITCLIRDYGGEHYHFLDGAEGGYAAAAMQLKEAAG